MIAKYVNSLTLRNAFCNFYFRNGFCVRLEPFQDAIFNTDSCELLTSVIAPGNISGQVRSIDFWLTRGLGCSRDYVSIKFILDQAKNRRLDNTFRSENI